ncbi:hypothetical protein ANO14919_013460 [Xylariales sp. No.14919]|nr:hypothetical protein ANO14919_013460 [Xylariales sp. No.14919]
MPIWTKLAVSAVFITGGFVTVVGIVRIVFVAQAYSAINAYPDADSTVLLVPTTVWTDIEVGFGVFCACIPTLRPILLKLLSSATKVAKGANSFRHDNSGIKTDGLSLNLSNCAYPSGRANDEEFLRAFVPDSHKSYAKLQSLNSSHDLTHDTKVHAVSSKFGTGVPQHAISVQQDFQWEEEYRH